MSFEIPDDRRYLDTHEWALDDDGVVHVGVSDFAQDELGDVVFVELPDEGDDVTAGESFGVIESIKAVSDLYAPVSGEVIEVNEALFDQPELVNESPYDDGWMLAIEGTDGWEDLLTGEQYRDQVE